MADGRFPFGAVGLVHVENRIVQHRPIGIGEPLTIDVRPTQLEPHPRAATFSLVTEATSASEMVWEDARTMLRRGGGGEGEPRTPRRSGRRVERHGRQDPRRPTSATSGGSPATSAAATPPSPATATRSTCTPSPRSRFGFPQRDRPRHVDEGPLPRRAREPPARRLQRRRPLPEAGLAARPRRVRSAASEGTDIAFAVAGRKTRHLTSTASSTPSRPSEKREDGKVNGNNDRGIAERSMGLGLRALSRLAGSDPARPARAAQAGRACALPDDQGRLPHRAAAGPHVQGGTEARQAGAPVERKLERPLRPHPDRRAADAPGGVPRFAAEQLRPAARRGRHRLRDARRSCSARPTSSGLTMLGVPEELGGAVARALRRDRACSLAEALAPRRHGPRRRGPRARRRRHRARRSGATPTSRPPTCPRSPARTRRPPRSRCTSRGRCSTRSSLETKARRDGDGLRARRRQVARARAPSDAELFIVAARPEGPARRCSSSSPATSRPLGRGRAGDGHARRGDRRRCCSRASSCRPAPCSATATRPSTPSASSARDSPGARWRSAPRRRCSTTSSRTSTSAPRSASRSRNRQAVAFAVSDIAIELEGMRLVDAAARPAAPTTARTSPAKSRSRAARAPTRACRSAPTACSCSAATATSRSTRSSAGTATCGQRASARAPCSSRSEPKR